MSDPAEPTLAVALVSELLVNEQLLRARLLRVLPKGMQLSHFAVLNHLAGTKEERSPAQLARNFHVTRAAMTNTLKRLEWAGYIHTRPDWDDARRKRVSISPAGLNARDIAMTELRPILDALVDDLGEDRLRTTLPLLRELRQRLRS